jgi:hypothetical protein
MQRQTADISSQPRHVIHHPKVTPQASTNRRAGSLIAINLKSKIEKLESQQTKL